jgi:hypothetical protein
VRFSPIGGAVITDPKLLQTSMADLIGWLWLLSNVQSAGSNKRL